MHVLQRIVSRAKMKAMALHLVGHIHKCLKKAASQWDAKILSRPDAILLD